MARSGGRPPKGPASLRVVFSIRLNAAELAELTARAAACGQTPRAHLRDHFFSSVPPRPVPDLNRVAWEQLSRALSNLNQLAHQANMGNPVQVSTSELAEVVALIRYLRRDLRGEG